MSRRRVRLAPLLESEGLDRAVIAGAGAEISLNAAARVLEAAARAAGEPCLGLAWAEAYPVGGFGAFGHLLRFARTVREAVQAVQRFAPLAIHPLETTFVERDGHAVLSGRIPTMWTAPVVQLSLFLVGLTVLRLRLVAGPAWRPECVDLVHRDIGFPEEIVRRALGSNVRYNAPANAIHLDAASLDRRAEITEPRLFEIVHELCERLLAELPDKTDPPSTTRNAIMRALDGGEVTLEAIAERLDLSTRSLQSRLAASGTSFDAVLQATRRELALGYLRDTDLTLTEIALLLGYSELSAFTRAAQRWFGAAPSALRQRLRQDVGV